MFDWLFGGGNAANSVVDGIKNGIDKLVFTDEEKVDANQKGLGLFIKYQEATQPQNVARRLISLIVLSIWGTLILLTAALYSVDMEYAKFVLGLLQTVVMPSFLLVVGFYFFKRLKG